MNKRNIIGSTVLIVGLLAAGTSFADDTTATLPGDQGVASVNKNLESNPDNKGLQTAAEQLKQNQLKQAEQTKLRSGKQEKHMEQHMEKRTERHEAMGRPAKIERPGK